MSTDKIGYYRKGEHEIVGNITIKKGKFTLSLILNFESKDGASVSGTLTMLNCC